MLIPKSEHVDCIGVPLAERGKDCLLSELFPTWHIVAQTDSIGLYSPDVVGPHQVSAEAYDISQ